MSRAPERYDSTSQSARRLHLDVRRSACSASRHPTCVHLLDQQGDRPVQVFVVYHRKEPAKNRHAESCRFNHPRELGLRRVQLLKAVIKMNRQPEEATDIFPIAVRVELGHRERGFEAVAQVEAGRRFWSELARRLHLYLLDVLGPARPLFDAGQVAPRLLKRQIDREVADFPEKQSSHYHPPWLPN